MLAFFAAIVFFIVSFVAAAAAVFVAWKVIENRSGSSVAEDVLGSDSPRLLKQDSLSAVTLVAGVLKRFDFVQALQARLAEAAMDWSVGRLIASMLLCGALGAVPVINVRWLPEWLPLVTGCAASSLPYVYMMRRRRLRLAKFEEQLPEALDFLSRALRAGHPFAVSLDMLAQESPSPLAQEMRKTHDERLLGLSWDQALENLSGRVPLVDVGFFAAAVRLQSRTGGKLGEVLGRLAETMRERVVLRGEIRSISAHGRLTGMVLTAIPLAVAAVLSVVNPSYLQILVSHPRGKDLIAGSVLCVVTAHFVIKRIVTIKV